MVQYEQGVYEDVRIAYAGFLAVVTKDAPLGDHLGPGMQGDGASDGQLPKRSLDRVCEQGKEGELKC